MEVVRTAQTAAETIATDHDGSYAAVSRKSIHRLEPSIPIIRNSTAWLSGASGTTRTYVVTATSPTRRWFSIRVHGDGTIVRTCAPAGRRCRHGRW